MSAFIYEAIIRIGDTETGSTYIERFKTEDQFRGYFNSTSYLSWGVLVNKATGAVVLQISKPKGVM